jgi:hypothetical protein
MPPAFGNPLGMPPESPSGIIEGSGLPTFMQDLKDISLDIAKTLWDVLGDPLAEADRLFSRSHFQQRQAVFRERDEMMRKK